MGENERAKPPKGDDAKLRVYSRKARIAGLPKVCPPVRTNAFVLYEQRRLRFSAVFETGRIAVPVEKAPMGGLRAVWKCRSGKHHVRESDDCGERSCLGQKRA